MMPQFMCQPVSLRKREQGSTVTSEVTDPRSSKCEMTSARVSVLKEVRDDLREGLGFEGRAR